MDDIGPQLPPHLIAKRKRQQEEAEVVLTPANDLALSTDREKNASLKRRRVVGPSLPPAAIEDMPSQAPEGTSDDEDSSSDDGIGPSLSGAASSGVFYHLPF